VPPARRTTARALFIVLVAAALAAAIVAGVRPLFVAGRTAEARWARIERDVRDHLHAAFVATSRSAGDLAHRAEVADGLRGGADGPQILFGAIEGYVRHPAASLAVTIFDSAGAARAWHGRPSELSGLAASAPAGSAVAVTALGFRVVRFEPIVERASSRRLGTAVVEQVISRLASARWSPRHFDCRHPAATSRFAMPTPRRPPTRACGSPSTGPTVIR
jgi:hypothetical protein